MNRSMKRLGAALLVVCLWWQSAHGQDESAAADSPPTAPGPVNTLGTDTPEEKAKLAKAQQLFANIQTLLVEEKGQEAVGVGTELVKVCLDIWGEQSAETALALHQLGAAYFRVGQIEKARKCQDRTLAIRRKVLGDDHEYTALALQNLATTLCALREFEQAVPLSQEALAIVLRRFGEAHVATADGYFRLAMVFEKKGDYEAARLNTEKALAIYGALFGKNHRLTVICQRHLGRMLGKLNELAVARACLEEVVNMSRQVFGEESRAYASDLSQLAHAMADLGDHAAAVPRQEQALAIWLASGLENPVSIGRIHHALGRYQNETGDFSNARRHLEQALAMLEAAKSEPATFKLSILNEIGVAAMRGHDLVTARSFFERSLQAATPEQRVRCFATHINLASTLVSLGDYDAARSQFQQAIAIEKDVPDDSQYDAGALYNGLGQFLSTIGKPQAARASLERALVMRLKKFGRHAKTANTIESLGRICVQMGELAAARKHFEDALAMRRDVLPENHPYLAGSFNDLGYLCGMQGDNDLALKYLQRAVDIHKLNNSRGTAVLYANLALFTGAQREWLAAARYEDRSRRQLRQHVDSVLCELSERDQLDFLNHYDRRCLESGLSMAWFGRKDPTIASLSAGWVINNKGQVQEVVADRNVRARESDDPKIAAVMKQLAQVHAQQARLTLSTSADDGDRKRLDQLAQLARTEETLSRQLARVGSRSIQAERWIEVDQVRKQLAPDEVFIDIMAFSLHDFDFAAKNRRFHAGHYAAWIIPPTGKGNVKLVDLGRSDAIDRAVNTLRGTIAEVYNFDENGHRKPLGPETGKQFANAYLQLSAITLDPLLKEIGAAKKLIISPDAGLWLVPWAALLLPDGRFAVEEYQISHVVSGRELVAPAATQKPGRPLIVASPNFDLHPAAAAAIAKNVLAGDKTSAVAKPEGPRAKPPSKIGTPLPIFVKQAELVAPRLATYAGTPPAILQGDRALEALVKAAHRPRVVLFATHGFFAAERPVTDAEQAAIDLASGLSGAAQRANPLPPDNPLLRCGVLLAGCNWHDASPGDDGILTGMEILGIDLRGTELVVLSACDTAVGDVRIGEGVVGVRQAFQLAGAQSVVSTLWPVEVNEATDQMNEFFTQLAAGKGKAEALRGAQLAAIKRLRAGGKVASPIQWAPFTITGRSR
jgi:CHAT domain-containing protein/tetratricopeptide (TPR) repeat protein